jgi:septum formation protein
VPPPLLVLASSSPYRRALLERLRLPFAVASPDVDERPLAAEAPRVTAVRLAQTKAQAVAAANPASLIIGSDQVAVLDTQLIGKPGTHEAALRQLLAARGRLMVFHTAVCVIDGRTGDSQVEEVPTTVKYRDYSAAEAERYLEIDRPYDCAGSAKIESLGIALIESVDSPDPTALIGLPLIALTQMLRRAGMNVLASE